MEVRTALHRVPVWVDGATVDATGQVAVGVGFSDKHIEAASSIIEHPR